LCQNALPTDLNVTVFDVRASDETYQWFVNSVDSTTGGTSIPAANSASYTPGTSTIGAFYYYVIVSQTEAGCGVTSATSELIIKENPTITTQPTSFEVCLDGTATVLEVVYGNGTGTPTYQWFSNSIDDTTTGTAIVGETNSTYIPPTNVVDSTFYYAEISFTSGGCSQLISETANVIVVPQLIVDPIAGPQTICVDGTADEMEVTYTGGSGIPTYQWFSNTSNTNTGGSLITLATTSKFTPNAFSSDGNFYYYAEISIDRIGCSLATSAVFEIIVLADPIIDDQPIASQELCQNALPTDLT
jgi:hypothetical protein